MKSSLRSLPAIVSVAISMTLVTGCQTPGRPTESAGKLGAPVGLQLYSLREQFAKDVPGTLDKVRDFGFEYVELAGTYGLTPEKFKAELDSRGLKAVSAHFPYEKFRDDVAGIAREAKVLRVQYVGCAWIAHKGDFNEK